LAVDHVASTYDFFSIGLLLKTLFSPFRQISAEKTEDSPGAKTGALMDKLVSRGVGFVMRSFMIVAGLIYISLQVVIGLVGIVFWAILPLLPFAGFILMTIGWAPQWL